MTGLSMVRMISHGVVCLAGRTESLKMNRLLSSV